MENIGEKHYRFLAGFMFVLCLLAIVLTVWAIQSAEVIYAQRVYEEIYAIKKTFLADTVHNVIRNTDNIRVFNATLAAQVRDRLVAELTRIYGNNPSRFAENAVELLVQSKYPGAMNLRLEDLATGRSLFRSPEKGNYDLPSSAQEYRIGSYRLRASLNAAWVDANTKTSVASMLHDQHYENGGYVWVNEILNWEGGDKYAIRRIHPNLKDTEGDYLSTSTKDIKGNFPYLEELEGVRDSGEVFFTYFFKRPENDRIAEKLSYATLYKEYNWIIAMGVYLEDVQTYIDDVKKTSRALTTRIMVAAVACLLVLFVLALLFLSRMERKYISKSNQAILVESNIDPLTGAYNRRLGDGYLADTFNKFQHGTETSALLLFDIDDFKKINDRYGHKSGDRVLEVIVNRLKQNMRASDHLVRWGGEEFLALCYGIGKDEVSVFAEKVRQLIERLEIPTGSSTEDKIRVTVSIGVAWFLAEDQSPDGAFLRADQALYRAKAAGKNCVKMQEA
jgi:diguanylate cyclase (GGDEF)-like protein